jgi:hypothetical protein
MAGGYCQIYCQIGGFEGIAGDKFVFEVSKLLISLMPPPSSNPSLSATYCRLAPSVDPGKLQVRATAERETPEGRPRRGEARSAE